MRNGNIVLFQHGFDVRHGVVGHIEYKPVEIRIVGDDVLPLPDFRDVGDVHADVFDERHQVAGGDEFRDVDKRLSSVIRAHLRFVKEFHERIESHSVFMIFEAVFFGADDEQSGAVRVFQALHRGIAAELDGRIVGRLDGDGCGFRRADGRLIRHGGGVARICLLEAGVADPFRLHHLTDIIAELVSVHMFQQIAFCNDARVVVVTDEMDRVGVVFDLHHETGFNAGAVVTAGVVEIGVARHGGRKRLIRTLCGECSGQEQKRKKESVIHHMVPLILIISVFSVCRFPGFERRCSAFPR